jgi:hypothetical protein
MKGANKCWNASIKCNVNDHLGDYIIEVHTVILFTKVSLFFVIPIYHLRYTKLTHQISKM